MEAGRTRPQRRITEVSNQQQKRANRDRRHRLFLCIGLCLSLLLPHTVLPSILMISPVNSLCTCFVHSIKHFLNASGSICPQTRANVVSDGISCSNSNFICSRSHASLLRQKSPISSHPSQFPITAAIVMAMISYRSCLTCDCCLGSVMPLKLSFIAPITSVSYSPSALYNPFGNTYVIFDSRA